jgi:hypothetical protein
MVMRAWCSILWQDLLARPQAHGISGHVPFCSNECLHPARTSRVFLLPSASMIVHPHFSAGQQQMPGQPPSNCVPSLQSLPSGQPGGPQRMHARLRIRLPSARHVLPAWHVTSCDFSAGLLQHHLPGQLRGWGQGRRLRLLLCKWTPLFQCISCTLMNSFAMQP